MADTKSLLKESDAREKSPHCPRPGGSRASFLRVAALDQASGAGGWVELCVETRGLHLRTGVAWVVKMVTFARPSIFH
jgi:hypothetical protein